MSNSLLNVATKSLTGGSGEGGGCPVNVGDTERVLSLVAGAGMALCGLTGKAGVGRLLWPALGAMLAYRGLSGHCSLYATLGVSSADGSAPATSVEAGAGYKLEHTVTINRPPADVYRYWRKLDNLPRFLSHLEEVRVIDARRSHWVAKAPLGMRVEWDAEIINERPDQLLAWRSREGADVPNAGSVHFEARDGGESTEVHVQLKYDPPAGQIGAAVARLLGGSPEAHLREDLQRLKLELEAPQH